MRLFLFFFSSRRRHTRWTGDWSSDVCSSDLLFDAVEPQKHLRIAIGDEAQNVAAGRMRTLDVCHDADGRRSEERRVGKECRSRWSPYDDKKDRYGIHQQTADPTILE